MKDWKAEKMEYAVSALMMLLVGWSLMKTPQEVVQGVGFLMILGSAILWPDILCHWPRQAAGLSNNLPTEHKEDTKLH